MKTEISELERRIRASFPLATIDADPPVGDLGRHHLDVRLGDRLVVVEWSELLGFGVSLILDAALEGGPDFRVADADRGLAIIKLLLSEAHDTGRDVAARACAPPSSVRDGSSSGIGADECRD